MVGYYIHYIPRGTRYVKYSTCHMTKYNMCDVSRDVWRMQVGFD